MPLDKDIVREMWVAGDLKDRLGIEHRRSLKNKATKLEFTPMFHEPHARSVSEVSTAHDQYEPMTRSPGSDVFMSPAKKETLLDTSTFNQTSDIEMQAHASFILTKPSFDIGQDDSTPVATMSGNALTSPTTSSSPHSPTPSYYSVSDIPPPSPLPEPIFRYSTRNPSTRETSHYTVRDDAGPSVPGSSGAPHSSPAHHSSRSSHSSATNPGIYEMRVRSPSHEQREAHVTPAPPSFDYSDLSRGVSETSYATAHDEPQEWSAERAREPHELPDHHRDRSYPDDEWMGDQSNRMSDVYNSSRPVSATSWEGGLAM